MRVAVIHFPGSTGVSETMSAIARAGMEPVKVAADAVSALAEMAGFVLVGGFSYSDDARPGIIAALQPVMRELAKQSELGKPILGIGNGAQILVEAGLVPGLENNKMALALTDNKRIRQDKILGTGYYNAWIHLRLSDQYQRNAFTRHLTPKNILHIPVAHQAGRFVMTDALLAEVVVQGLNVFQYCDATGEIADVYPVNPNGSMANMAAISNKAGNVMAIMPHLERTTNGDAIFLSMHDYIKAARFSPAVPLYYYPRHKAPTVYRQAPRGVECVVVMKEADPAALVVEQTLRQLGIPVSVRRALHWEIEHDDANILSAIKETGVLYDNALAKEVIPEAGGMSYLVRAKEDWVGLQKCQVLARHFEIKGLTAIHHGVLWHFSCDDANMDRWRQQILGTNLIGNPYVHDYYQYSR